MTKDTRIRWPSSLGLRHSGFVIRHSPAGVGGSLSAEFVFRLLIAHPSFENQQYEQDQRRAPADDGGSDQHGDGYKETRPRNMENITRTLASGREEVTDVPWYRQCCSVEVQTLTREMRHEVPTCSTESMQLVSQQN